MTAAPRVLVLLLALATTGQHATPAAPADADDLLIVDCLLPGQIRQLGHRTRYLSARRPVKTTALDCRVRSGEYVVEDQASMSSALNVWLAAAEQGSAEAQTTVGEIFERGLGVPPDYPAASSWYLRAAEAGHARAEINLGNLYERGLGVARDPVIALSWYRRAAGLDARVRLDTVPDVAPLLAAEQVERQRLQHELARLEVESSELRSELVAARQLIAAEPAPFPPAPTEPPPAQTEPPPAPTEVPPAPTEVPPTISQERDAPVPPHEATAPELDALREVVTVRERDLRALGDELTATRAELEAASRDAALARANEGAGVDALAEANREVASAREESDRRRVELATALERLADREQALVARSEMLTSLESRLASIESRAQPAAIVGDAEIAEGLLAGPEIALIDPVLPGTRGLVKVTVPQALERRRIVGRVTAPAGLLSVAVNDMPAEANPAGVFTAEVAMSGIDARVAVSAIDRQGKRSDVVFVLTPSLSDVPVRAINEATPPDVDFGAYHALLIGNSTYARLPRLNTPGEDITALDHVLRSRFGFETKVVRDATRYEILSALNEMRAKLKSTDNLLVYFAGHGELDPVNMRGYWLPVDAEPDSTANWISNVTITDILNVIPAKQILLVVDSCYSGTLTRSSIAGQQTTQTDAERATWLALMANKKARVVLTSGGLAPVLDAGGGSHSVFAKALLETLESVAEITEGQALYRSIAARVAHAAARFEFEQTPQFAAIAHAGHESGDFFLLPTALSGAR